METVKIMAGIVARTITVIVIAIGLSMIIAYCLAKYIEYEKMSVVELEPVNVYTMRVMFVRNVEVSGPTREEIANMQLKCKTQYDMVEQIQRTRILSGDSWEDFKFHIEDGYHPGEKLGHAITPRQIKIKDKYWEEVLQYGDYIFHNFDRGWAPDKVAVLFLEACMIHEEGVLRHKYMKGMDEQTYDI